MANDRNAIEVVARWIEESGPGVNLESTRKLMAETVRALASHTGEAEPTVFIDFKQATDLMAMFGGEPNEITLQVSDGHSGRGMYASYTDMPEEGTIFLGNSDQEAMPDTPPAATPAAPSDDEQLAATLIHCSREVSPIEMTGYDLASVLSRAAERIQSIAALSNPAPVAAPAPIDMVLHCPKCGLQHVDAPEATDRYLGRSDPPAAWSMPPWKNEPHRSHLCHGCGHIWRPADVPTNGVEAVRTTGKNDSPIAAPAPASEAVAENQCSLCNGRGFYGSPGARCEWCKGTGKMLATPYPGDSADAPVQQAGDEQDLIEAKALAESEGSRAVKYLRIIRKVRAVLDEWPEVDIAGSPPSRIRTIIAFAGTPAAASEAVEPWMEKEAKYEAQMRETHAALKGEQPAEPSGGERGEV